MEWACSLTGIVKFPELSSALGTPCSLTDWNGWISLVRIFEYLKFEFIAASSLVRIFEYLKIDLKMQIIHLPPRHALGPHTHRDT